MISTGEQDGWAYAATGSETYALWERHRQRQLAHVHDLGRHADMAQVLTELRHAHDVQRKMRG
jgi:mevalonate pyrophosphate decarboxylase